MCVCVLASPCFSVPLSVPLSLSVCLSVSKSNKKDINLSTSVREVGEGIKELAQIPECVSAFVLDLICSYVIVIISVSSGVHATWMLWRKCKVSLYPP